VGETRTAPGIDFDTQNSRYGLQVIRGVDSGGHALVETKILSNKLAHTPKKTPQKNPKSELEAIPMSKNLQICPNMLEYIMTKSSPKLT